MTSPRFGTEELHRVLDRLGACAFLKDFRDAGKAVYVTDAKDGILHGISYHIERRHSIALVVTPILFIDHKQAGQILDAGLGVRRSKGEVGLVGGSLWEVSRDILNDRAYGGEYGLVPSAAIEVLNYQGPFQRGFWRSMHDLEDLAQHIDSDLQNVGPQFFRERDTIPKVIEWLKSDPSVGGTASRIIVLCLNYVQGRHEEILKTVKSWTGATASPMELRFAKYMLDLLT